MGLYHYFLNFENHGLLSCWVFYEAPIGIETLNVNYLANIIDWLLILLT